MRNCQKLLLGRCVYSDGSAHCNNTFTRGPQWHVFIRQDRCQMDKKEQQLPVGIQPSSSLILFMVIKGNPDLKMLVKAMTFLLKVIPNLFTFQTCSKKVDFSRVIFHYLHLSDGSLLVYLCQRQSEPKMQPAINLRAEAVTTASSIQCART